MPLTVVPFPDRRRGEKGETLGNQGDGTGVLTQAAERANALIELSGVRGVYTERLPEGARLRSFFDTLREKRKLYIIQAKDGPLLGTDKVCVLSYDKENEVPDKIPLSVASFYKYTAPEPTVVEDYMEYVMSYGKTHKCLIQTEDEDPSDFESFEQKDLVEIPDFQPEKIPMVDPDPKNGYAYEVIETLRELYVSSTGFRTSKDYTPSLLFLLIEAADQVDYLEGDEHILQLVKYGSGTTPSGMIVMNHEQFLALIDASILRAYSLIPEKYDTPEKRRDYIRTKFVVPNMKPLGEKADNE